jgi:hypothetical protein
VIVPSRRPARFRVVEKLGVPPVLQVAVVETEFVPSEAEILTDAPFSEHDPVTPKLLTLELFTGLRTVGVVNETVGLLESLVMATVLLVVEVPIAFV